MKDLLSNEEIDTLLQMFRAEGEASQGQSAPELALRGEMEADGPVVAKVDILKPNRLSRDQIKNLERLFDTTGRALGATIGDKLRLDVPCECVAVEQMRFASWLQLISGPSAIYVVKLPPFEQSVLFTATSGLLYSAVDRILGGTGKTQKVPSDFSMAEYTVADAFVGPCLDRVCDTLADWAKFSWNIDSRFCNPSLAQIFPQQEVMLSVHFQTSGEFLLGDLRLGIPYVALEPYLKTLDLGPGARFRAAPGSLRKQLEKTLAPVGMELAVELGTARLPMHQLMALKPGDVVPLDRRVGDPLVAPVQGKPKFVGQVGLQGNRMAFQVAGTIGERA